MLFLGGRVPNIRFNVAKMLQSFIPIVEPTVSDCCHGPHVVALTFVSVKIFYDLVHFNPDYSHLLPSGGRENDSAVPPGVE